jgi:hypothetical protein
MELDLTIGNPCSLKKDFCRNCHNHYAQIRPHIEGVVVSNHFSRDINNEEKARSIIETILECSHRHYTELHKFEKHVLNNILFRAKIDGIHIVYSIDKAKKLILFLRAFKNYSKYKRFLENDRGILKAISRSL